MPMPRAVRTERRLPRPGRAVAGRVACAIAVGVLGGLLAGCGSSKGTARASVASSTSTTPPEPPGAAGVVAALSGSSMEVQAAQTGQTTVKWTASTTFTQAQTADPSAVVVGACATVTGAPAASPTAPITARTVTVTPADPSGSCTEAGRGSGGGFGGGFGGGGARRGGGTTGSSVPRNRGTGPNGGAGASFAMGKIIAVSPGGFTLEGFRRDGRPQGRSSSTTAAPAQAISVVTDGSTTYTRVSPAGPSALAVGDCVTARGPADDTGAVTATAINIRPAGPNGCGNGPATGRPSRTATPG